MKRASEEYLEVEHQVGNLDEFGEPYQRVRESTTDGDRQRMRRRVHAAMKRVLDRAFDLRLLEIEAFDDLIKRVTTGTADQERK